MISQLDDLLAIAEVVSLNPEFLEYRQVYVAGRLTFANDMAAVICELSACNEHRNFTPVMRPPFLTHTVVACGDGDRLIHQRPARLDVCPGEFVVEVCQQRKERRVILRQPVACFLGFWHVVCRDVMVVVFSLLS